ncbi:MAG: FAD-dependent oxidoreductase, partial [Planctomycetota bacterium]
MTRRGVIVVGGGVAGLAAAIELAGRGVRVTLLESRRRLGGRAGSFHDKATGETLDNCQHVALGCCTSYLELLQRLGSLQRLVWTDRQYWIMRGGREHVLAPDPLPSPLHLTRGLCSAPFLSLRAKAAVVRAIADAAMEPAPSAGSFADWLRERQQPIDAVRHFWWPLMVSACNLSPAHLAAGPALRPTDEAVRDKSSPSRITCSAGPAARCAGERLHALTI